MNQLRNAKGQTEQEFLASYHSDKYPKPSLTADVCMFAVSSEQLELLLIRRGNHPFLGRWALPGGFAEPNESLENTAARELMEETSVTGIHPELVGVFSRPGRDPRGWTVSAAYRAFLPKEQLSAHAGDDASALAWFRVVRTDSSLKLVSGCTVLQLVPDDGQLAFDHRDIILAALER